MSIKQDLQTGSEGEKAVSELLQRAGIVVQKGKRASKYLDLIAQIQDKTFTLEVKNDKYAAKSGNIAIETYNPKSKKNSGISVTQSDIWVHIACGQIWIANTRVLKTFLSTYQPTKIVEVGGDGNATLYLYRMDFILPAVFVRIDELGKDELLDAILKALDDGV